MKNSTSFQGRQLRQSELDGRTVQYVADQLIIGLKPQFRNDRDAQRSVMQALPENSSIEKNFDRLGTALIQLPPSYDPLKLAEKLKSHNAVEFVEPNYLEGGDS